jgi:hypothetical protein
MALQPILVLLLKLRAFRPILGQGQRSGQRDHCLQIRGKGLEVADINRENPPGQAASGRLKMRDGSSPALLTQDIHRLGGIKFVAAGGNHQQTAPLFEHGAASRGDQSQFHFIPHDLRLERRRRRDLKRFANPAGPDQPPKFVHRD